MEEKPIIRKKYPMAKIRYNGILLSKLIVLLSLTSMVVTFALNNFTAPYNIYTASAILGFALYKASSLIKGFDLGSKPKFNPEDLLSKDIQLSKLLTKIYGDINRFENAASYYFRGVKSFKYTTMFLAGLSTVLLGLDLKGLPIPYVQYYPNLAKNSAFIIGAVITGYTSIMTYWNIEKYWLQNKSIAHKLRGLKDQIENLDSQGSVSKAQIQEQFENYQTVKNEFYKYWEGALSSRSSQGNG